MTPEELVVVVVEVADAAVRAARTAGLAEEHSFVFVKEAVMAAIAELEAVAAGKESRCGSNDES